eukprot:m.127989 g.127989  ORF g.127989 m.127989 type:complete len:256 (-) comp52282_c0_seq6:771-1538(-)
MGATSSSSLSPVEIYKELFPTSKKAVRDCRELLTGALEAFLPPTAFLNKDRLLDYKQLATASVPVALCLLRNLPDETRATLLLLVFGRAKDPDWSKCLSAEIIASIQLSTQLEIISFLGRFRRTVSHSVVHTNTGNGETGDAVLICGRIPGSSGDSSQQSDGEVSELNSKMSNALDLPFMKHFEFVGLTGPPRFLACFGFSRLPALAPFIRAVILDQTRTRTRTQTPTQIRTQIRTRAVTRIPVLSIQMRQRPLL